MKKILIGKRDTAAEVVGKILNEEEADVVIVIPRNALLKESAGGFELIKREAAEAGKNISLESVDEVVLAMAKAIGLDAVHPLFSGGGRGSSLTDIIPKTAERKIEIKRKEDDAFGAVAADLGGKPLRAKEEARTGLIKKSKKSVGEAIKLENDMDEIPPKEKTASAHPKPAGIGPEISFGEDVSSEFPPAKKKRPSWKLILVVILPIAAVIGIAWIVTSYFSRVQITINFNKTPWIYEKSFLADKAVSKIIADKNILQAEVFVPPQKNIVEIFKASSIKTVSAKASGKITIYNAYSSVPQSLVATTRFVAPDGKVFRLNQKVTVPGALIKNGKITPSSIMADISADQAGPDYNVGPIPKLTIPGFKGSPKYDGFYGEITGSLSGGFIGQRGVPTPDDISGAKDKVTNDLRAALSSSSILINYPPGFKILDGAIQLAVTKLTVGENTEDKSNFTVFGEASVKAIGFRESDLKSFLLLLAKKDNPDTVFDKLELTYGDVSPDFKNEKLSFSLKAQGVLKPDFPTSDFRGKILSRSIGDVRSLVSGIGGLSSAKVSVWPFWLREAPADPKKVDIFAD